MRKQKLKIKLIEASQVPRHKLLPKREVVSAFDTAFTYQKKNEQMMKFQQFSRCIFIIVCANTLKKRSDEEQLAKQKEERPSRRVLFNRKDKGEKQKGMAEKDHQTQRQKKT